MAEAPGKDGLLDVTDLDVGYGAIQVVWGFRLQVKRGQVASIIGPNGAGKTTTLKALAGVVPVRKGKIIFEGQDVTGESCYTRGRRHLGLIPEGRQLWPRLSGEKNPVIGSFPAGLENRVPQNLAGVFCLFSPLNERPNQLSEKLSA